MSQFVCWSISRITAVELVSTNYSTSHVGFVNRIIVTYSLAEGRERHD